MVLPCAEQEPVQVPGSHCRCSLAAETGWRDEQPKDVQMDRELTVGLFIACILECGCKFVNLTLVTALQKSSECRKWTRAGTCCPKCQVRVVSLTDYHQFRQSVFDGAIFFISWLPAASQPDLNSASPHCKPAAGLEEMSTDQKDLWPAPVNSQDTSLLGFRGVGRWSLFPLNIARPVCLYMVIIN